MKQSIITLPNNRCLVCNEPLEAPTSDPTEMYHNRCSTILFDSKVPPNIPYTRNAFSKLAKTTIENHVTIPGVQKKSSMTKTALANSNKLTFLDYSGRYIVKPSSDTYQELPENEALTMHLARLVGIKTVPSGLAVLKDEELVYITKRIDRTNNGPIHMDDFCQLSSSLTEDKYKGSIEQIGRIIQAYSAQPGLDMVRLLELVIFCFLTGNGDMHLKNFSLIHEPYLHLSPAYDLLNTRLVIPERIDNEESALTIQGRRRKLTTENLYGLGSDLSLTTKQIDNIFTHFSRSGPVMLETINHSFLSHEFKERYCRILLERSEILHLAIKE